MDGSAVNDRILVREQAGAFRVYDMRAGFPILVPIQDGANFVASIPAFAVGSVEANGGNGNDLIDLTGVQVPATINGGAGSDILIGGISDDVIHGGTGNDVIAGSAATTRSLAMKATTCSVAASATTPSAGVRATISSTASPATTASQATTASTSFLGAPVTTR